MAREAGWPIYMARGLTRRRSSVHYQGHQCAPRICRRKMALIPRGKGGARYPVPNGLANVSGAADVCAAQAVNNTAAAPHRSHTGRVVGGAAAAQHAWPPGLEVQARTGIHRRSCRVNNSAILIVHIWSTRAAHFPLFIQIERTPSTDIVNVLPDTAENICEPS